MHAATQDPLGYYKVLNVSPGANEAEIRLAYTFLKNAWQQNRALPRARIREAFECLSDPRQKAAYDTGKLGRGDHEWLTAAIGSVVLAALVAFAGLVFPGFLLSGPQPYRSGDTLVRAADQGALGQIVRQEAVHRFPNGQTGSAYLVKHVDGTERWYPAGDLERHYRRR